MTIDLTDPIFHDEAKARAHLEAIRWPDGPICPHCGTVDQATLMKGKSHRPGLYQCNSCREPFTVTVGSVMERSKIPLHKWVAGFHIMAASKKGVSAHQLMRMLGLGSYRTAWFMAHRIREAMTDTSDTPLGGSGKTVEADETYIGTKHRKTKKAGAGHKMKVVALVERGGRSRAKVVEFVKADIVRDVLVRNADRKSDLRTDESNVYIGVGREFASHESVDHKRKEWGRGDVHTNTIEGYFSVFKRGMKGVYQHCGEQHLQRYLNEFDFRYSNRAKLGVDDTERAAKIIEGAAGKRLTYQQTGRAGHA